MQRIKKLWPQKRWKKIFLITFLILLPILIFYPLASGVAYSIYYTATNIMVFNSLSPRRNGSHLGVFSALSGVATLVGSFTSGFLSFYGGFSITFIISGVCLVVSAWVLSLIVSSTNGKGAGLSHTLSS